MVSSCTTMQSDTNKDTAQDKTTPHHYDNLWDQIVYDMNLPTVNNERIEYYKKKFLNNPYHLNTITKRSKPFLHLLYTEFKNQNLPIELIFLPFIESSFDVFAYSAKSAAGLWQFTQYTGEQFGLTQDWWYDGRRDIYASTVAAGKFFTYLNKKFDDNWLYSIAAYNTGEGRVLRAIAKNRKLHKKTDYFSLNLPDETERYVPQLLALIDIVKHAEQYNVRLPYIKNEPYLRVVSLNEQIDLHFAAKASRLSLEQIQKLNPGFNQWLTPPNKRYYFLLPKKNVNTFTTALRRTPEQQKIKWVRHVISSGETLSHIAKQYNITTQIIMDVNHLHSDVIKPNMELLIPSSQTAMHDYKYTAEQRILNLKSNKNNFKIKHTVRLGESLWSIAKLYDVSINELIKWNTLEIKKHIKEHDDIIIWLSETNLNQNANSVIRKINYKVENGDSLYKISDKFKISINDIVKWNQLNQKNYLQPGQSLLLFVDIKKS